MTLRSWLRALPRQVLSWLRRLPRRVLSWLCSLPRRSWARFIAWCNRPEPKRVDRSRMYMWVHIGLVMVGVSVAVRPASAGVLTHLDADTNRALAVCMIIGSGLSLIGTAIGGRWFFPKAARDVRLPYMIGVSGQLSVIASLTFYTRVIWMYSDTVGTLGGGLSLTILCACVHISTVAIKEIVRVQRLVAKARVD